MSDDVVVTLDELDASFRDELNAACIVYRELSRQRKEADDLMEDLLDNTIKPLAARIAADKVTSPSWQIVKSEGGRTDIDAKKLLSKGVDWDTINFATIKKTWPTVRVIDPKGETT